MSANSMWGTICASVLGLSVLLTYVTEAGETEKWFPEILKPDSDVYLPDYSYAGYMWGEKKLPDLKPTLKVTDYGAVPNDGKDDTEAIRKALEDAKTKQGTVVLHFPAGRFILSHILFIERSDFVLQGSGSGRDGTTLYCPKPLEEMDIGHLFKGLKAYLEKNKKKGHGGGAFSFFAWSGGVLWTRVPRGHEEKSKAVKILSGKRDGHTIELESAMDVKPGDIVEVQWFNREGVMSSLLKHIYGDYKQYEMQVGKRLWQNKDKPKLKIPVTITAVNGKTLTTKEPLLHDIRPEWTPTLKKKMHLQNVGFEHFKLEFPKAEYRGHHCEAGYNGLCLHSLAHSWVRNVHFVHADSAVLVTGCKNMTIHGVQTVGRKCHYNIKYSTSYGILSTNFKLDSKAHHNPSFNTGSKLCVFSGGSVKTGYLDQHKGMNHMNLFDDIAVEIGTQVFKSSGNPYWGPRAGLYNTFWNIRLQKASSGASMKGGNQARLVGFMGPKSSYKLKYEPNAYIEGTNKEGIAVPSLYRYQLEKRLAKTGK